MIEITNGLVNIKVPKQDLKTYLNIGWIAKNKEKKAKLQEEIQNKDAKEIASESKQK